MDRLLGGKKTKQKNLFLRCTWGLKFFSFKEKKPKVKTLTLGELLKEAKIKSPTGFQKNSPSLFSCFVYLLVLPGHCIFTCPVLQLVFEMSAVPAFKLENLSPPVHRHPGRDLGVVRGGAEQGAPAVQFDP